MEEEDNTSHIKVEKSSPFNQTSLKDFYTISEILAEFTKPCGRFKSPLSFFDKLELQIAKIIGNFRVFRNIVAIPNYTIPPNWQVLLNYLYEQDLLTEPRFMTQSQRNDFPRFAKAGLALWNKDGDSGIKINTRGKGFGTSFTMEEAYSKAIGEFLERYLLTLFDTRSFTRASYAKMIMQNKRALDIELLPQFLPWQKETFPHFVSTKNTEFYWTGVRELISGAEAYVPAQLMFWGNEFQKDFGEPYLCQPTTNGQAGGFTFEESVLPAIYEAVERDSFLMFWLNTISPPILDVEREEDIDIQNLLTLVKRYGLKVHLLDTTTDIEIPSCVCVVIDERGEEPFVAMGGSAGLSFKKNILSSMTEALNVAARFTPGEIPLEKYTPFTQKTIGQDERIHMWHGKKMLERFNFFISGKRVQPTQSRFGKYAKEFVSARQEYTHVLDTFKNKGVGYELYCYGVHHPVLKKIGYHVTKIIVPQLMQLYLNEHLATLDCARLREVPALLGYKETKLNPWPHPFP